jgi:hypothetical protein
MTQLCRLSPLQSRFDREGEGGDPMAAMATLVDVMLVFACGLMAAVVLSQQQSASPDTGGQTVERSHNLPEVPRGVGDVGGGYEAVGRVFRDAQTGKLILVESSEGRASSAR